MKAPHANARRSTAHLAVRARKPAAAEAAGRSCESGRVRRPYRMEAVAWRMLVGLHQPVSISPIVCRHAGASEELKISARMLAGLHWVPGVRFPNRETGHGYVLPSLVAAFVGWLVANAGGTTVSRVRVPSAPSLGRNRSSVVEQDISPNPCRNEASPFLAVNAGEVTGSARGFGREARVQILARKRVAQKNTASTLVTASLLKRIGHGTELQH